jgi:hypothetical protein
MSDAELRRRFRAAGRAAHAAGLTSAPILDPEVVAGLTETAGDHAARLVILNAWATGWHSANLEATA